MKNTPNTQEPNDRDLQLSKIAELIESVEFGTVVIKVQNGKIVQIEKTEKYKV